MKVTITVEGKPVQIEKGKPIIEGARELGIFIPTLCYHEALKGYGACRLCIVEVVKNKKSRLVTSCNYPAEEGLEIFPNSRKPLEIRKMIVQLLLARSPGVPLIHDLAARLEVEGHPFRHKEDNPCVLCGLCVRVCHELVGLDGISLVDRGIKREVAAPYHTVSDVCIGCGACSYVCPTGRMEMAETTDPHGRRELIMEAGTRRLCGNQYLCEACDMDKTFLEGARKNIAAFREEVSRHHPT